MEMDSLDNFCYQLSQGLLLLVPVLPHGPESLVVVLDGVLSQGVHVGLCLHPGVLWAKHLQHGDGPDTLCLLPGLEGKEFGLQGPKLLKWVEGDGWAELLGCWGPGRCWRGWRGWRWLGRW